MMLLRSPSHLGALFAGALLLGACAAPSHQAALPDPDPRVAALETYYAEEGLPAGWQLDTISAYNDNVFVTVRLTESLWAYEQALPGSVKGAFFSAICPSPRHPVWQAIDGGRDIVIEAQYRPQTAFHTSCREHASGI